VAGAPAASQFCRIATSAAVGGAAGAGGIGLVRSFMRSIDTSTTRRDGLLRAGAIKSAYVMRDMGVPTGGGAEWQL
jgi:hypothetical protein